MLPAVQSISRLFSKNCCLLLSGIRGEALSVRGDREAPAAVWRPGPYIGPAGPHPGQLCAQRVRCLCSSALSSAQTAASAQGPEGMPAELQQLYESSPRNVNTSSWRKTLLSLSCGSGRAPVCTGKRLDATWALEYFLIHVKAGDVLGAPQQQSEAVWRVSTPGCRL